MNVLRRNKVTRSSSTGGGNRRVGFGATSNNNDNYNATNVVTAPVVRAEPLPGEIIVGGAAISSISNNNNTNNKSLSFIACHLRRNFYGQSWGFSASLFEDRYLVLGDVRHQNFNTLFIWSHSTNEHPKQEMVFTTECSPSRLQRYFQSLSPNHDTRSSPPSLYPGDMIIAINGRPVSAFLNLQHIVSYFKQCSDLVLVAVRHGDALLQNRSVWKPGCKIENEERVYLGAHRSYNTLRSSIQSVYPSVLKQNQQKRYLPGVRGDSERSNKKNPLQDRSKVMMKENTLPSFQKDDLIDGRGSSRREVSTGRGNNYNQQLHEEKKELDSEEDEKAKSHKEERNKEKEKAISDLNYKIKKSAAQPTSHRASGGAFLDDFSERSRDDGTYNSMDNKFNKRGAGGGKGATLFVDESDSESEEEDSKNELKNIAKRVNRRVMYYLGSFLDTVNEVNDLFEPAYEKIDDTLVFIRSKVLCELSAEAPPIPNRYDGRGGQSTGLKNQ